MSADAPSGTSDRRGRARLARGLLLCGAAGLLLLLAAPRWASGDAPVGRYVIPGDGTVYDTKTKLTWQRTAAAAVQWYPARQACADLTTLPGTGWRLPTIKELQTLIDFSRTASPYIDAVAFPNMPATGNGAVFWSATPLVGSPSAAGPGEHAWNVYFDGGGTFFNEIHAGVPFRCVR